MDTKVRYRRALAITVGAVIFLFAVEWPSVSQGQGPDFLAIYVGIVFAFILGVTAYVFTKERSSERRARASKEELAPGASSTLPDAAPESTAGIQSVDSEAAAPLPSDGSVR